MLAGVSWWAGLELQTSSPLQCCMCVHACAHVCGMCRERLGMLVEVKKGIRPNWDERQHWFSEKSPGPGTNFNPALSLTHSLPWAGSLAELWLLIYKMDICLTHVVVRKILDNECAYPIVGVSICFHCVANQPLEVVVKSPLLRALETALKMTPWVFRYFFSNTYRCG